MVPKNDVEVHANQFSVFDEALQIRDGWMSIGKRANANNHFCAGVMLAPMLILLH